MVKIIGKFSLLLSIVFMASGLRAGVVLHARNLDDEPITQVVVGQPFVLDVSVDHMDASAPQIEIEGLADFSSTYAGLYLFMINGSATTRCSYRVSGLKIGSYAIGPAVVTRHGKVAQSNVINLEVVSSLAPRAVPSLATTPSKADILNNIRLELAVDKSHSVVGQKIVCTLSLFYPAEKVVLRQIGRENQMPFKEYDVQGVQMPVELVDGKEIKCVQRKWFIYPDKPGEFIIPAYAAQMAIERNNNYYTPFVFGQKERSKTVYSNAIVLTVDPLPENVPPDIFVGSFVDFSAKLTPSMIKEGAATILVLELAGQGNFDMLSINALENIPEAIKYYSSNQQLVEVQPAADVQRKKFEFVLQGITAGVWQIPAQSFSYFDETTATVKTIKTEPVTLTITRDRNRAPAPLPGNNPTNEVLLGQLPLIDESIAVVENDLNEKGPWSASLKRTMPWSLFWFLLFLPVFLCNAYFFGAWYCKKYRHYWSFCTLVQRIGLAREHQDGTMIHLLLVNFLSERLAKPPAEISSQLIEERLRDAHFSVHEVEQWQQFWLLVNQHAFDEQGVLRVEDSFFENLLFWVKALDKIL